MNYSFDALFQEFAAAKGFDAGSAAQGLEFECDGVSVWIVPHPLHADRLLAEVSVLAFDGEPPAPLLALMLQINETARFEHDWSIVMDAALEVSLTTSVALPGLTMAELESLMLDGVERGQLLQAMLTEVLAPQGEADGTMSAPVGLDPMMLMGRA